MLVLMWTLTTLVIYWAIINLDNRLYSGRDHQAAFIFQDLIIAWAIAGGVISIVVALWGANEIHIQNLYHYLWGE